VAAPAVLAVAAAAALDRQDREALVRVERHVLPDRGRLGAMDRDAHLVQPGERSRPDAATMIASTCWLSSASAGCTRVRVVLVAVGDRGDAVVCVSTTTNDGAEPKWL